MVTLTRLGGSVFALNPDLIERIDQTPDTVITLVDGTKYIVSEPLETVIETIIAYRARIVAAAGLPEATGRGSRTRSRLSPVPVQADAPVVTLPDREQ